MGKHSDLALILVIILVGMFIPFVGAVSLTYGFDLWLIGRTFGLFLVIFACELGVVMLYFWLNSKVNPEKFESLTPDHLKSASDKKEPRKLTNK